MCQTISSRVPKRDEGWAWVVAFACFTINFIAGGLARTAGVLYVALIDGYGISREAATMPFSIRVCVRNSIGPVVGLLGQRYGIRPITTIGGIITAVGAMICFVAPDVFWITIFWGVIHGVGFGLATILHMIAINQYFDKHRATAFGIGYSGDCFGAFAFPDLVETLLYHYDVKGTFLILGAVILNLIPAALLLRPPPWIENRKDVEQIAEFKNRAFVHSETSLDIKSECKMEVCKLEKISEDSTEHQQMEAEVTGVIQADIEIEENNRINSFLSSGTEFPNFVKKDTDARTDDETVMTNHWMQCPESSLHSLHEKGISFRDNCEGSHRIRSTKSPDMILVRETHDEEDDHNRSRTRSVSNIGSSFVKGSNETRQNALIGGHQLKLDNCQLNLVSEDFNQKYVNTSRKLSNPIVLSASELRGLEGTEKHLVIEVTEGVPKQSLTSLFIRTNIKPIFILICASRGAFAFLYIAVTTIIVDYAADHGIPSDLGKYLIIGFSVADLIGRISCGQIIDRLALDMKTFALMTLSLIGVFVSVIPLYSSFTYLMTCIACYSFVHGGTVIMFPILIRQHMEKDEEAIAMGCLNFYAGLLMLLIAPMIGHFRDSIGSYNSVFYIVGVCCLFVGMLWQLEPLLVKKENKLKNIRCYLKCQVF